MLTLDKHWQQWDRKTDLLEIRGNMGDNVASLTSKQPWCPGISQKEQGTER